MTEQVYVHNCKHEIDDETKRFVEGKGFVGICKLCGVAVIQSRIGHVQPRIKPKMSKKERIAQRRKHETVYV